MRRQHRATTCSAGQGAAAHIHAREVAREEGEGRQGSGDRGWLRGYGQRRVCVTETVSERVYYCASRQYTYTDGLGIGIPIPSTTIGIFLDRSIKHKRPYRSADVKIFAPGRLSVEPDFRAA